MLQRMVDGHPMNHLDELLPWEQRKRFREMRLSAAARGVRVPDPSVPPLSCPWLDGLIARQ